MDMSTQVLAKVKDNILFYKNEGWFLSGAEPLHTIKIPKAEYKEAAVLFLISYHHNQLHVLLTKRSTHVRTYKGQSCLPGGTKDQEDSSLVETALREAEEEIGLDRDKLEVICSLPPQYSGLHGTILVTPVVALLKCLPAGITWTLNPLEVECAYWVPLEVFLDGTKARTEVFRGIWRYIIFTYTDPETKTVHKIFGLTSVICATISAMALDKSPDSQFPMFLISKLEMDDKALSIEFSKLIPIAVRTKGASKL